MWGLWSRLSPIPPKTVRACENTHLSDASTSSNLEVRHWMDAEAWVFLRLLIPLLFLGETPELYFCLTVAGYALAGETSSSGLVCGIHWAQRLSELTRKTWKSVPGAFLKPESWTHAATLSLPREKPEVENFLSFKPCALWKKRDGQWVHISSKDCLCSSCLCTWKLFLSGFHWDETETLSSVCLLKMFECAACVVQTYYLSRKT